MKTNRPMSTTSTQKMPTSMEVREERRRFLAYSSFVTWLLVSEVRRLGFFASLLVVSEMDTVSRGMKRVESSSFSSFSGRAIYSADILNSLGFFLNSSRSCSSSPEEA